MDKKNLTAEETEGLRKAVLDYLGGRHPLKWSAKQIAQGLRMRGLIDFDFGTDDLASALQVLLGKKLVDSETEPLGSTVNYCISADGLIQWERRH
jgi:hypothetical protein